MMGSFRKKCALFFLFVALAMPAVSVRAAEEDAFLEDLYAILPPSLRAEETEELISRVGVRGLLSEISAAVSGKGGEIFSFLLLCIGSSVLVCAAAHCAADASLGGLMEGLSAAMMGTLIFEPLRECSLAAVRM